jgi:hypothetical protein
MVESQWPDYKTDGQRILALTIVLFGSEEPVPQLREISA